MNATIVEGDLLDQDVDVIVNAWNSNIIPWWLLLPQGVSGAIKKRGGTASGQKNRTNRLLFENTDFGRRICLKLGRVRTNAVPRMARFGMVGG